jgi:hypothetical protein
MGALLVCGRKQYVKTLTIKIIQSKENKCLSPLSSTSHRLSVSISGTNTTGSTLPNTRRNSLFSSTKYQTSTTVMKMISKEYLNITYDKFLNGIKVLSIYESTPHIYKIDDLICGLDENNDSGLLFYITTPNKYTSTSSIDNAKSYVNIYPSQCTIHELRCL